MTDRSSYLSEFELGAGALCLDFANTLDGRLDDRPTDLLASYTDLIRFGELTGALEPTEAHLLREAAEQLPQEADASRTRAVQLREVIFRIFDAVAIGSEMSPGDVEAAGKFAAEALARGALHNMDGCFVWRWIVTGPPDQVDFDRPWLPIAQSAVELLQHGDLDRVRRCAADDCGVLFIDTTRNQSRKWCSSSGCGNRSRVRRHRARAHMTRE